MKAFCMIDVLFVTWGPMLFMKDSAGTYPHLLFFSISIELSIVDRSDRPVSG